MTTRPCIDPPSCLPDQPLTRDDLLAYFEAGCKPKDKWRIGTEHEKFLFDYKTLDPIPYDGERGVGAFLEALRRYGWSPKYESGNIIGLMRPSSVSDEDVFSNISLEPGGQIELSGAPLKTIHQTCKNVTNHLEECRVVSKEMELGLLGIGVHPLKTSKDLPWMPKRRYEIMRNYMPKKGTLGVEMMNGTNTIQANFDYASEADMVQKVRVSMALQPFVTALFANSPFAGGKPNGYQSYRSHIWRYTDPDRTGILPFVFDRDFGFERLVEYYLDVPMYLVIRDGKMIDVAGSSFRDFMAGKLTGFEGCYPTIEDWDNHLTTIFPEVRVKQYFEVRGADGAPWDMICALPAFWAGLLYDKQALDQVSNFIDGWDGEGVTRLREEVPQQGMDATFRGSPVYEHLENILEISKDGLNRRGITNAKGEDESVFLTSLFEIVKNRQTQAQKLVHQFENDWSEDISRLYRDYAY